MCARQYLCLELRVLALDERVEVDTWSSSCSSRTSSRSVIGYCGSDSRSPTPLPGRLASSSRWNVLASSTGSSRSRATFRPAPDRARRRRRRPLGRARAPGEAELAGGQVALAAGDQPVGALVLLGQGERLEHAVASRSSPTASSGCGSGTATPAASRLPLPLRIRVWCAVKPGRYCFSHRRGVADRAPETVAEDEPRQSSEARSSRSHPWGGGTASVARAGDGRVLQLAQRSSGAAGVESLLLVSMKEGCSSSADRVRVVRVRGRCGGGERRSCLYRPSGVGIRLNGRLVPAAHFQREPSGG
jgi:hypothetical protein